MKYLFIVLMPRKSTHLFYANGVDPDQMPRSVVSEVGRPALLCTRFLFLFLFLIFIFYLFIFFMENEASAFNRHNAWIVFAGKNR